MLYRPPKPRLMWGLWTIVHDGVCHVFYNEDINADEGLLSWQRNHDHVGHIVSTDLVNWQAKQSIPVRGEPGTWNEMPEGQGGVRSGMVVRHDGQFYLFAGAMKDSIQRIGVWLSGDMNTWQPHPANPVLNPSGPYYLDKPTDKYSVCWRDPHIMYCDDGYYHCVLCARQPDSCNGRRQESLLAHARSKDLINWENLPPFSQHGISERFWQVEEPEIFQFKGRHYLMFDGGTTGGMRTSTPAREDLRGTFYAVSENFEGTYYRPQDDFLIGNDVGARNNGKVEARNRAASTSRLIFWEEKPVILHFVKADRPVVGTPKLLNAFSDGALNLEYMPVVDKLDKNRVYSSISELPEPQVTDYGTWNRSGNKLSGYAAFGGTAYDVSGDIADFSISFTLRGESVARAGVVFRISHTGEAGSWPGAVGLVLDYSRQRVFIGGAESFRYTGWFVKPFDICRMCLSQRKDYFVRCLVRDEHFEVYIDNQWVFTSVIPEASKIGYVQLIVESGRAGFSDFCLSEITPLP